MKVKVDDNLNMVKISKDLKDFEAIYTGVFFVGYDHLSIFKEFYVWNGHNTIAQRRFLVFVDIYFRNFNFSCMSLCQLFQYRRDYLARHTPRRPEIYNNRDRRRNNFLLESRVSYL